MTLRAPKQLGNSVALDRRHFSEYKNAQKMLAGVIRTAKEKLLVLRSEKCSHARASTDIFHKCLFTSWQQPLASLHHFTTATTTAVNTAF
jgi:hypothetical protein